MLHRNDDVARQRQLAATAQREAVHGGDHWLDHPEPLGQSAKTTRFEREPVRQRRAFTLTAMEDSAGSVAGPSNAPRPRKTAWISATSSWRGDVWWRTASAAATPAASPTTNIGGISRLIF